MLNLPRLVVSGLSGGAGKTMVSLGLTRAFARSGLKVRAFKKGPDYIDAAWLALAAKAPQGNLDPFFTPGKNLLTLFCQGSAGCDLALVEGNRGIFDGLDISGSCSTAEVARIIEAPVLLVLDCTKMTRTAAALVNGCLSFEEGVRIGGVILNRTGNSRHRDMVRRAVEDLSGVPVLGVLPRRKEPFIMERHMGLAGMHEHTHAEARLNALADFMAEHVDLEQILALARTAAPIPESALPPSQDVKISSNVPERPVIGYVQDAAFWFYYQENLDALTGAGAQLVPVSLLDSLPWPTIDGLYLGGGFPELYVERLSADKAMRARVAGLSRAGLPVYAECGGFMYLAENLTVQGKKYPMAGVFPCTVEFCDCPQGLGYVEAETVMDTPFHPRNATFRGHEFHFSRYVEEKDSVAPECTLRLHRGRGMIGRNDQRLDGLLKMNTFASYTHIYAPALPDWAPAFVALCRSWRKP